MCFKQNVAQHTIPRTTRCSVKLDRLEQSWCLAFSFRCVNRRFIRLPNYRWEVRFTCRSPTLGLRLYQPFVEWVSPASNLIRFVNGERSLRRHFGDELSLSLILTGGNWLKCARLIYETIVSGSLQWSSGSSWDYVHTDLVHTILLPEHAKACELIVRLTIPLLLSKDCLR